MNVYEWVYMCHMWAAQSNAAAARRPVEVKLLCGADVLESFAVVGLWKPEHVMYTFHCVLACLILMLLKKINNYL